jgi:hypothetical protein
MSLREELLALLGNWSGTEQLTPLDGPVTTARAMFVAKLDVADRVVLLDYRQVAAGGSEYSGHGVFTEDLETRDICWWFFDSSGSAPTVARGRRSGNGLVLVADDDGRRVEYRFAVEEDDLSYTILVSNAKDPAISILNGRYRRISGH